MADVERTHLTLASALLRCADASLLDAPLDSLREGIDEDVRELLRALHEDGEARTLRELLEPATLDRWASEASTPRELSALRAQLRRWLGDGHAGDDDPARLARIPSLPTDLEAMIVWARSFDLLGELSRPAREVLGEERAALRDASIVECCFGKVEPPPGASVLWKDLVRDAARAHLLREAADFAAVGARTKLWAVTPADPSLALMSSRLRALIADETLAALSAVRFVPARRVSLDEETGVARGEVRGGSSDASITVTVFLSGFEQRALHTACGACKKLGCLHVRALAGRLLDACLFEADRLHAPMRAFTSVPSWKRFLEALALRPSESVSRAERIGFRLRLEGERARVGVVVQRKLAHGGFSAGKLVAADKVRKAPFASEHDRPALETISVATRTQSATHVPASLGMLRSLVEHPFVELDGIAEPLRLREQTVEVTLLEQADGLLPKVSLAGKPLAPGERPRDAAYVLTFDRPSMTLVFAALTPALRRLLGALSHFRGVLPKESYPALAPWVASLEKVARVVAPKALRGMERPTPKKLLLRITPGFDEGIDVALTMRALPMAPPWPPGHGPELCQSLEDGVQVYTRRDLEHERALATRINAALEITRHPRLEPFAYRIETTQGALDVLARAARLVDELDIEWAEHSPRLSVTTTVRTSDLNIRIFKKGQWFELSGGSHDPAGDVAIGRLLDAARRGDRFVLIKGHDYAEITRDLFERLELAQLCMNESVREPAMSTAAAKVFMDALGARTQSEDEATTAWLERARTNDADTTLPALGVTLRDYQRDGVRWLLERSRWAPGVCLADEMGLGKTVQAIALLVSRAHLGGALVIAPTSVVGNWEAELSRVAPSLLVRLHRDARGDAPLPSVGPNTVLLTSYELLQRDTARFVAVRFATEVIDEAQMVKNARTLRAEAVAGIDADFRLALSGTPVENRLGDLWSLFHLVAPGLLGSAARFRSRFAVPIERYEREDRRAALRTIVSPFILRRTKRDVAPELPSRTEVVHMITLSEVERNLYDGAVRQARRAIGKRKNHESRTVQILAELTRLRQLACHPRLVLGDERAESSKLEAFVRLMDDILPRGHRVLVFSQFTGHLALVKEALDQRDIGYLYLDGATPASKRTELVSRFQGGESSVFLISLKAGGTGLNLTGADYVVHMDPWWNPAAEDQASDRAHRLGQDKPITIVKLVAEGTIEEKVLAMHAHKRELADAMLEGADSPLPLDANALEALLTLG